jgi:nicotinamidase-related amidase
MLAEGVSDIIMKEHRVQRGFANTDLDHQPKELGIKKIVILAMVANACTESPGRFGMEIGYHLTLVKNADRRRVSSWR